MTSLRCGINTWRVAVFAAGLMAVSVCAQTYPSKTIRIVTGPAASGSDIVARLLAPGLSASLGQPVVVENRAGIIAVESSAKAPPDGHTLLVYGSVVWMEPLLRANAPWDPVRDFAPITLAARSPNILVVHPSLPVKTVKDLIALAKSKPGELRYASAGSGTTAQLAAELFKSMAGKLDIVHVPYKGLTPALIDLMSGRVHLSFAVAASVVSQTKSGKMKALAVTSAKRATLLPVVPTLDESGLRGYELVSWYGVSAPTGVSNEIITRLNAAIGKVVNVPAMKDWLIKQGFEPQTNTPAQFAAFIGREIAQGAELVKATGLKVE